jgi:nucleotide-binding universal stress UspA family protein
MMKRVTPPSLLIPVTFPDPDIHPLTDVYIDALDGFDILLLGYWEHTEDTTSAEARSAHETDAKAVLYEIAARFSHAGAATDIKLHFGPGGAEKQALQERVIAETNPDGVLLADHLGSLNNILVPLRDERHIEKIVEFVSEFDTDNIFVVELYHAAQEEGAVESAETMLRRVEDRLLSRGFSESDLEVTVDVVENAEVGIGTKARSHNIVIMGETEQSNAGDHVFSSISDYLTDQTETPVLIVR